MKNWISGRVVEKTHWTDTLFSVRFDAPLEDFNAGQFIQVAMDIEGERVARPYSLVNAPHERPLEIYFNEVPEGPLTPRLSLLEPGDSLWVSAKASGVFVMERIPECRDLWMFATGTALGVYLSILKTAIPWQRFEKVVLVHGCRTAQELNYQKTILMLADRFGDQFHFVPALSRERAAGRLPGRVTDLLETGVLERTANRVISPDYSHIMLCGNEAMIRDMRSLLEARGLQRHTARQSGHYTTEKYH
ncbi:MAG: ferredoxin--NADP reductase [Gammaproteobacteria bacterium]|nr:ferredoxin--NADP reductase [Gammaproteobacteria bacterium]